MVFSPVAGSDPRTSSSACASSSQPHDSETPAVSGCSSAGSLPVCCHHERPCPFAPSGPPPPPPFSSPSQSPRLRNHAGSCGTVGSGVVQGLARNGSLMGSRLGMKLSLAGVAVRNAGKARAARVAKRLITPDWESLVRDPKIDVVMELMGGTTTARKVLFNGPLQPQMITIQTAATTVPKTMMMTTTASKMEMMTVKQVN